MTVLQEGCRERAGVDQHSPCPAKLRFPPLRPPPPELHPSALYLFFAILGSCQPTVLACSISLPKTEGVQRSSTLRPSLLFFFYFCTPALPCREQDRLCRAGSRSTLGAAVPQDGWDVTLVSGATPAPGERSWKMVSLSIRMLSGSKAVRWGRRGSRSPPGAAQKRGRNVCAASPSAGRLVLPFLGQQSSPSPALAVVLQSHCTAYPFLKSTPHKYFVKHLLANVLFF